MGSLNYLTVVEAVPDLKNPDFIFMTLKDGNFVLEVDKEIAKAGTYNFGIDILHVDGQLAKRIDLPITLANLEDVDKNAEESEANYRDDDEKEYEKANYEGYSGS